MKKCFLAATMVFVLALTGCGKSDSENKDSGISDAVQQAVEESCVYISDTCVVTDSTYSNSDIGVSVDLPDWITFKNYESSSPYPDGFFASEDFVSADSYSYLSFSFFVYDQSEKQYPCMPKAFYASRLDSDNITEWDVSTYTIDSVTYNGIYYVSYGQSNWECAFINGKYLFVFIVSCSDSSYDPTELFDSISVDILPTYFTDEEINEAEKDVTFPDKQDTSTQSEYNPFGYTLQGTYYNDYFNVKLTLPDNWTYLSTSELAQVADMDVDTIEGLTSGSLSCSDYDTLTPAAAISDEQTTIMFMLLKRDDEKTIDSEYMLNYMEAQNMYAYSKAGYLWRVGDLIYEDGITTWCMTEYDEYMLALIVENSDSYDVKDILSLLESY